MKQLKLVIRRFSLSQTPALVGKCGTFAEARRCRTLSFYVEKDAAARAQALRRTWLAAGDRSAMSNCSGSWSSLSACRQHPEL